MQAGSQHIDRVDAAIMAVYAASTEAANYSMLSESISSWDEEIYPEKNTDEVRIAEELYKLMAHLEKKGLKRQSDEVFRIMLLTFPERHFAQSPVQSNAAGIGFEEFKPGQSESMSRFEDCFRMAIADSERLAHDIDMRQFREGCIGLAGDLFTAFYAAAKEKSDSENRDLPWKLIHQLAWHLNNVTKAYNPAYGILKTVLSLQTLSPTPALADELENSMGFFKRNHYWSRIDRAAVTGDQATMILYIDRLMPIVTAGHEKSNLIMLRAKAVKKTKGLPVGCLLLIISTLLLLYGVNYLLNRYESTNQGKTPSIDSSTDSSTAAQQQSGIGEAGSTAYVLSESATTSIQVFNRAGLYESKPPSQPLGRKLSLSELRYVIFQKQRLEHLEEIELSPQEEDILRRLWGEWRSRGENVDYMPEDRKKVETEAELYSAMLKGDAEDQLKQLVKVLRPGNWKKDSDDDTEVEDTPRLSNKIDQQKEQLPQDETLLNLRDAADIKKVLMRLEEIGYYNGPTDLVKWNRVARSALARFKAAKMLRIDDEWDIETQQALFSDK